LTEPTDAAILAAARKLVAAQEAEAALAEASKRAQVEHLEVALKMALTRMMGDIEAAANLFERWCEQDPEVRALLQPLIREALTARLTAIPKAEAEVA
jgi:RecB family exonuclease